MEKIRFEHRLEPETLSGEAIDAQVVELKTISNTSSAGGPLPTSQLT